MALTAARIDPKSYVEIETAALERIGTCFPLSLKDPPPYASNPLFFFRSRRFPFPFPGDACLHMG